MDKNQITPLIDEFNCPKQILAQCSKLNHNEEKYISHPIIEQFGIPNFPMYFDQAKVTIEDIVFQCPMILPIYNPQLEMIQCAVMQNKLIVKIVPENKAKGFSYLGSLNPEKPIFITYDLESFFKIAASIEQSISDSSYSVVLVILPNLCKSYHFEPSAYDFKQILHTIHQLSNAGYTQLYVPVRPEKMQDQNFLELEQKSNARLLNQYLQYNGDEFFCDLHKDDHEIEIRSFLNLAVSSLPSVKKSVEQKVDNSMNLHRLACLTELEYEQTKIENAKKLGIKTCVLDKLVKAERIKNAEQKKLEDLFQPVEPWNSPVDGNDLLNRIEKIIDTHIVCEPSTRIATALWILFTWAIDAMQIAPIACITAPEKRCGKTQLLTLISELCYKPLPTSNISSAALFRAIDHWKPTLLIDEADAFLKNNEDLRSIINAGHSRKNAYAIRCDGDENKPATFCVWGAKAISGIGRLPETIEDRSILLRLRRKLPSEKKQRLRQTNNHEWFEIRRMCFRWIKDNFETIQNIYPVMPDQLNDRAQDNWEALFKIAQTASSEWLKKAEQAALAINNLEMDTPNSNEQLLTDIKKILVQIDGDKLFGCDLLNDLIADPENIWATYDHGNPMTRYQLNKKLREFGIRSKDVNIDRSVKKGYETKQFKEAFLRYLS